MPNQPALPHSLPSGVMQWRNPQHGAAAITRAPVAAAADVGISAEAHGGLGEITAKGLHEDGSRYYNDLYGKAPVSIKLNVQGGVGAIHLIPE